MKNADIPAMPVNSFLKEGDLAVSTNEFQGLTKREMFAMNAMQGILSNSGGVIQGNNYSGTGWCNSSADDLAKLSVECADALLKEL